MVLWGVVWALWAGLGREWTVQGGFVCRRAKCCVNPLEGSVLCCGDEARANEDLICWVY